MKKNITLFLVVIALAINVLNFDYANFNMDSMQTWLVIVAFIGIIVSIIFMFIPENKINKKAQ